MLTEEKAKQLKIESTYGLPLENQAFRSDQILWKKKGLLMNSTPKLIVSKRFEFYKKGKTLGIQTKRFLTLYANTFFYFEDSESDKILGYCEISNVYAYFLRNEEKKFILYLTNGANSSLFYFDNNQFFEFVRPKILKDVIQLNYTDKYAQVDLIGQGSFSKVYLVKKYGSGQVYAAKIIPKKDKHNVCTKSCVQQQKKILAKLRGCQYIYKIQQFFQEQDNYIFILEHLSGKDLMTIMKEKQKIQTDQALQLLKRILDSINFCHQNDIIHRDIKPQNIIVDPKSLIPKLIDFGLSLQMVASLEPDDFKRCGTMGYMAPQVVQNTSDKRRPYDYKCDVFSFGIVAHMLLMGTNPLKGKNYEETYQKNKECKIELDLQAISQKLGNSGIKLFNSVFQRNPKKRSSAAEVLDMNIFKKKNQFSQSTNCKTKEGSCSKKELAPFEEQCQMNIGLNKKLGNRQNKKLCLYSQNS